ncbi:hypothetical protein ACHAWO_005272 [Cyclotella atomus]|jgi:hypothetical protein|uniref:Uncharacterized protein n=1 Tax=Cyclotella atomus TaxID=382360 RepID=A0ABD3NDM6_9STRA
MSDDNSSEDDVLLSSLAGEKRQSRGSVNYNEGDDDSEEEFQDIEEPEPEEEEDDIDDFIAASSDEDQPLVKLKSSKAKTSAKKSPTNKAVPKKKETSAKKKPVAKSKSSVSSSSSKPGSGYNAPSIELYTNCDKGKLIQSVLVRWWYAYSWPSAECQAQTPKNYTALDGFPGVFVCTSGSDVGIIKDFRDHSTAPTFKNFARKSATELKDLLLKAIDNQRKALNKIEGEGTGTEKNLRELEKWANKLNCSKADKEAEKVLKAARLMLS